MSETEAPQAPQAITWNGVAPVTSMGGLPLSPDREEVLGRARELVPNLRSRHRETAQLRRLPDASVEEMRAAGMWDLARPKEFGGYELDTQTLNDVVAEIARGCGSTAWVCSITNALSFLAGTVLPKQGREEVYASGLPLCSPFTPRSGGEARRVDGGYLIEQGEWPWASASQIAGWVLPRATLMSEFNAPIDAIILAIPIEEVEIIDEWHTTAMRGTASNVVKIENVFVPEHRAGLVSPALTGEHLSEIPPAQRQPWITNVSIGLGAVGVGLGRAAIELYQQKVKSKPILFTSYMDQAVAPTTHLLLGEASQMVDAADMLMHRAGATLDFWALRGEQAPLEARLRIRADLAFAAKLCGQAVNDLYEDSGASSIAEASSFGRVAADIHAVTMHAFNKPSTNFELYGAALAGAEPPVAEADGIKFT